MNKRVGAEVMIIAPGHSRRLIQSYEKCIVFTATNNTSIGAWIMIYDFILSHR